MAALFYKAPFIGELAAEGGLRGCFVFSENGEQPLSQRYSQDSGRTVA